MTPITDDELLETSFGGAASLKRLDELHDVSDIIRNGIGFATKTGNNPKAVKFEDAEHCYVRVGDPHQGAAPSRDYVVFKNALGRIEDHDVEAIRQTSSEVIGREFVAFVEKGREKED